MRILKFTWFSPTSKDISGHSTNLTLSQKDFLPCGFKFIIQVHPPMDPIPATVSIIKQTTKK